ncbi:Putative serine esterase [Lentzea waywayandensis]|uniref:Putative serine esterase n=2 Tax=Lentzea waywayandensis TaxID=84724 RepID=A0A1I6DEK7_9PSEU|nr:Putative serine esterase [Lentzea waywayandensis]
MTTRMRKPMAYVLALLLAVLPAVPARAQPTAEESCAGTPPTLEHTDLSASRRPVVLVHGWAGERMTETATILQEKLGSRVSTFTFDYGPWSLHWASNEHIAPCLAIYITKVAKAHKDVRGDGKVVVVAHSMGGLALRYAMSWIPAGTVLEVITLGTPHLGSPWGGPDVAPLYEKALTLLGKEKPPDASGGHCLAWHEKGAPLLGDCGPLPPYLPAGVTVTQVAGDITVDRSLFGFTMYSLPLSTDGIVPVTSAHGYATSGDGGASPPGRATVRSRTQPCRADFAKLHETAALATFAPTVAFDYLTMQDLQRGSQTPTVMGLAFAAMFIASCGHKKQLADPKTTDQIVEVIKAMPPPFIDTSEVRFDGIGEFTLALTATDLRARGYVNKGNQYQGQNAACVRYAREGQPLGFSVESASGRVLAISNSAGVKALHTQVGNIRVNSTLSELRTAFAGHQIEEHLDHDFGQGSNGVIVNGPNGAIAFSLADAPSADYVSGRAAITYLNGVGLRGHAPTSAEDGC